MNKRLSFSAVSKYLTCGKMYDFHYNKKLRPVNTGSALLFGSAFDKAIEASLSGSNDEEVFIKYWTSQNIKGLNIDLRFYDKIDYFKSDLDLDLLSLDDRAELDLYKPNSVSDIEEAISKVRQADFVRVREDVMAYYKYACWLSLKNKGLLMLRAFDRDIRPRIKEVISLQRTVELANQEGDSVVGYVDMVVRLDDDRVVVVDLKTASKPYEENSVKLSSQLGLYSFALASEIPHDACAYAVIIKKPKKVYIKTCGVCGVVNTGSHKTCAEKVGSKRCGGEFNLETNFYCETQFIVDTIADRTKRMVVENFNEVNKALKADVYPRNLEVCTDYYGSLCPYFKLCHEDDSSGLEGGEPLSEPMSR